MLWRRPQQRRNAQICNRWETIKEFGILDHESSVEDDEMVPSLKVKRRVVESRYESLFDSLYDGQSGGCRTPATTVGEGPGG